MLSIEATSALVPILLAIAYTTLIERKLMAALQLRIGPNDIGLAGLLQPLADGAKLLIKEHTAPASAYGIAYALAPIFTLALSLAL